MRGVCYRHPCYCHVLHLLPEISSPVTWSYQLSLITVLLLDRLYFIYLHYVYDPSAVSYQLHKFCSRLEFVVVLQISWSKIILKF